LIDPRFLASFQAALARLAPAQLPIDPGPSRERAGAGLDPEMRQYINHFRYEAARNAGNITWAEQEPNPFPLPVSLGGRKKRRE
jgi:hypothetical protein